jgi:adenylate cyclase class IV
MAFDTIEIEIKVKINSSEVAEVKSALNKVAQLSKTEHQIDTYYVPEHENYMAEKYPYKWFSIRSRGDKNILNFKHFYPEGAEKTTHCHEYETAISDAKNMHAILSELKGFSYFESNPDTDILTDSPAILYE